MKSIVILLCHVAVVMCPSSLFAGEMESATRLIPCGTQITVMSRGGIDLSGAIVAKTADSLIVRTKTDSIVALDSSQFINFFPSELKSNKRGLKFAGIGAVVGLVGGVIAFMFDDHQGLGESAAGGAFLGSMAGFMLFLMGDPILLTFDDIEQCDTRAQTRLVFPGVQIVLKF